MKSATTELLDFLNTAQEMTVVDCYTFEVLKHRINVDTGDLENYYNTYRFNTWDQDLAADYYRTFVSTGPLIERDRVRTSVGVEVDTMTLRVFASPTMTLEGMSFIQACARDVLDGARVTLERAYLDASGTLKGTLVLFTGAVAGVKASRSEAELSVVSDLQLLNIQMPRNLYQAGCQHTVYDSGCGLNRAAHMVAGTVTSPSTTGMGAVGISAANGYYDMGSVLFTSGALAGTMRTVKMWSSAYITFVNPLPVAPANGDTFKIWAGCDKTVATCKAKFNNEGRYRGFPFVPVPETAQ
jgi:uncharacterized phage protein (TIGR02218 family)